MTVFHHQSSEMIEILNTQNVAMEYAVTGFGLFWYLWSTAVQDSAMQYLIYFLMESLKIYCTKQ